MLDSPAFRALVRHELRPKGNWRKRNRRIPRQWLAVYFAFLALAGIGAATYYALQGSLRLETLWYPTAGLPYACLFLGLNAIKKEADNDTNGWWLTLPYPRLWLVSAKWIAAWLAVLLVAAALLVLAALYGSLIAVCLPAYSFADVGVLLMQGINWLVLVVVFAPAILAVGMLLGTSQMTALRPLSPVLWVAFLGGGGMLYSLLGSFFSDDAMFTGFSGSAASVWFPYKWPLLVSMIAALLLAYGIIRLCAFLLHRKLSL